MEISKKRPEPRILLPADLTAAGKQSGITMLTGYYVENSNYFNITPADANIDQSRVEVVGCIVPVNIFAALQQKVELLDVKIDKNLTAAERFQAAVKNRKAAEATAGRASRQEIEAKLATLLGNEDTAKEIADWWNREDRVVGYWENDALHIIQCKTFIEVKTEAYSLKLDVFSRNTGILESSIMLDKGALLIGCGSVGSLVAVELAKAGVGRFMLVDNDIFGYHNICRHQCGIYDVGRYKTDAVADRILQINPYAKVVKKNCMIQEVDRDEVIAFCGSSSIAIGGADNREGDLYACQLSVEAGMPFMSVGCWERAFAGEIFYCLPQGQPTYDDFLDAVGYVSGRVTQNRQFYTTEEDLAKVSFEPGISADVNFVTIIAIKMALDLLNRDNPEYTQRLIPHLTQYTLVCNTNNTDIGGEQAAIFTYPLQVTTSIIVPYKNKD